jgi:phosphohistidine phosphatase
MRRLLLLRHAKSSWAEPGLSDRERRLSERGRRAAELIAAAIEARGLLPDRVLCSPAKRARETLAALTPRLGDRVEVAIVDALYEPAPPDYADVIAEHGDGARKLLVVGHNPAMQRTALVLMGPGEGKLQSEIAAKFPAGGLAVLDFKIGSWAELRPNSGQPSAFITPRGLARAEDGDLGED